MFCNENACGIGSEFASVNNEPNDGLYGTGIYLSILLQKRQFEKRTLDIFFLPLFKITSCV
jgi:hypothetical protein